MQSPSTAAARPGIGPIGPVATRCDVVLAPMSGVSDLPFRRMAHKLGAGLVVSEMVAGRELAAERADVMRRARGEGLSPYVIQLVGCEEQWMAEGARIAEGLGADIIDINMGCPAREVTGRLSGSALMRDLDHASQLISAVVDAVRVPVTLKMRLGWDERSLNAPELARRAEAIGVKLVTVHARTRQQFFKGSADWSKVRAVADAVRIPVVVNGDITNADEAGRALEQSGARGVMVGRGAYGAPWAAGMIGRALATGTPARPPSLEEQRAIATEHLTDMLVHYGRELGARNARKHIGWYLASSGAPTEVVRTWRARLCTDPSPDAALAGLTEFYERLQDAKAAA
ncbi:MAG: tRNA dihydrouridine synthase DusB [Hyphomicrobiales bacterium]|nr:tRNA dihydrouridine synthase DusB [Hyphomicrobiales bacterium]